jgi:homoserine kinase type II
MAVYTPVSRGDLARFIAGYDVGTPVRHEGIAQGVANTNYFVTATGGEFVLTLFEALSENEIPFFLDLTAFLAERDVPCARPVADRSGRRLGRLCGRPAALVERLPGRAVERPQAVHCAALGDVLARMHTAAREFPRARGNPFGPGWRRRTAAVLAPRLGADDRRLLESEMDFQEGLDFAGLPAGIVHADLFRDNALFEDDRLCGVIDFYFACTDVLLLDLAVCVNDWCVDGQGNIDVGLASAMQRAYEARRPLRPGERAAWPAVLRAAALRFWLSRLHDRHFPRPAELAPARDPGVFRRILARRRADGDDPPARWPAPRRGAGA